MAAERYGLKVLARNIEDLPDNKTRFLVLGRQDVGPSGQDKSSILVSTKNEPGALFRVLEPFHRHEISLTRIETPPARSGDWSYVFFIDFDGHAEEPVVRQALDDVSEGGSGGPHPRLLPPIGDVVGAPVNPNIARLNPYQPGRPIDEVARGARP